jgi:hypothetical protein
MKFLVHLSAAFTLLSAAVATFAGSQTWAASGIGGSGGGPRMERVSRASDGGQLVTVQVCDGGESGTMCREVTYRVRPESKPQPIKCTVIRGEAEEVPCPKNIGVSNWIKRLNESFGAGSETTAAAGSADYSGGQ